MSEAFDKLKHQLEQETWPGDYLFKFIAPSDNQKIALITHFFDDSAEINMRPSSNGNYTSISVKTKMDSADEIIEIYKKTSKIDKVIII